MAPRLSICRPLQNKIILVEPAMLTPNKRIINIENDDRNNKIDSGKKSLIPSLSNTSLSIKLKNLIVSLIGEIEDLPFLCLYAVGI